MATVAPEDAPRSGAKYMDKVEVESEHGPEGFGPVKIFWYEDQVRIRDAPRGPHLHHGRVHRGHRRGPQHQGRAAVGLRAVAGWRG